MIHPLILVQTVSPKKQVSQGLFRETLLQNTVLNIAMMLNMMVTVPPNKAFNMSIWNLKRGDSHSLNNHHNSDSVDSNNNDHGNNNSDDNNDDNNNNKSKGTF